MAIFENEDIIEYIAGSKIGIFISWPQSCSAAALVSSLCGLIMT